MAFFKNCVLVLFVLGFMNQAFAGTAFGKIKGYLPYSIGQDQMIFFTVEGYTDIPTCNVTSRLTMKSTNPKFEITNAAILSALMSGIQVKVRGTGACNNFSNSEDLDHLCLGDIPCW